MNIEIVEFYAVESDEERRNFSGTIRVKLVDSGIHILGIGVVKKKDFWFFSMPGRVGSDHKTGKPTRFPFVVFEDREMQRQLVSAIREKGIAFIEKRLSDTESPVFFPQMRKKDQAKPFVFKAKINSAEADSKPVPKKNKVWTDPPPLKRIRTALRKRF